MCKLESIKWAVVKSNKMISNNLLFKLTKVRYGSAQENTYSFYYFDEKDFNQIISILESYNKIKFEVVKFYDKQFGMTINSFDGSNNIFENSVKDLPLSKRFYWFSENSKRKSVTPITEKQYNSIIKIN